MAPPTRWKVTSATQDVASAFARLRQLRQQRGWSQEAIADVDDISKPTIQRIAQAKFSITLDLLLSLARGLEMPLGQLMDVPPVEER